MSTALLAAGILASPFATVDPSVAPVHPYLDGPPVAIAFHLRAAAPVGLLVDVTREATGGPHQDRGGIGAFGQPRSGGRIHEGFDVVAACGTPLVAARGGRVITSSYDDVLYGWHVIIRNAREHRDYWYSHLIRPPLVQRGQDVRTGRHLGDVGATGNARTVGCHLHFEIHQNGIPIDPAPSLHAWDTWS